MFIKCHSLQHLPLKLLFFPIIPQNNLSKYKGIFTHVCEHYLSELPSAHGGACPCTNFLAIFHSNPASPFLILFAPLLLSSSSSSELPLSDDVSLLCLFLFFMSRKYSKSSWMLQAANKEIQLNTNSFGF